MSGDLQGNKLNANNPNDLTINNTPKDPVIVNGNVYNRYVIPLIEDGADTTKNQEHLNRILKALKGSGIIHFKPLGGD